MWRCCLQICSRNPPYRRLRCSQCVLSSRFPFLCTTSPLNVYTRYLLLVHLPGAYAEEFPGGTRMTIRRYISTKQSPPTSHYFDRFRLRNNGFSRHTSLLHHMRQYSGQSASCNTPHHLPAVYWFEQECGPTTLSKRGLMLS